MKINTSKVSGTAWGDVDKTKLGNLLAEGYASGDITRAQIEEVYAFVPANAFGTDADGKKTFAYTKAWGPHHEVISGEIVLNRAGLGAAAAALAGRGNRLTLTAAEKGVAVAHLRKHYREEKLALPNNLKERKMLQRGKPLEELVKGSLEYTISLIQAAFNKQFPGSDAERFWTIDTFSDYVVVSEYGDETQLNPGEYFQVNYHQENGEYIFDPVEKWEVVEQGDYKPEATNLPAAVTEKRKTKNVKGHRLEERMEGVKIVLEEASADGGMRRIRANDVIVAGVVNGNGRRYPAQVVRAMVEEARGHLHESLGQGRAILLGEAEHPSDKSTRRPNLLETVVVWDEIPFDGRSVGLGGTILGTSKGKDIQALMEGGVMPGVSLRGYGDFKSIQENEQHIDEVTEAHATGFDLVLEPSFEQAQAVLESIQSKSEEDMNLEELLKLLKEHPEAFAGITEAQVKTMGETQLKKLEETLRSKLGLEADGDIGKALDEAMGAKKELAEQKRKTAVDKLITEATKDLPYGKFNAAFVEAVKAANPQDEAAVKALIESKRKEYDGMFSAEALKKMGFTGKIQGVTSVLENETGTPEYARAAFELTESIHKAEMTPRRNLKEAKSRAEIFTAQVLERFDALYKHHLIAESRMLEEAEQVSDLNLPYSVSRAIIEEAFPDLVAANIFDVGIMTNSPDRLYYETFAGETGYSDSIDGDESVVIVALNTWYALAHGRLTPGTVVVKNSAKNVVYTEGVQYVIDYANGKIKVLKTVSPGATVKVTAYSYTAVRNGEMQPIERGKLTLAYKTLEAAADRLADQISREAVVFSRSQLGYDATARTLANLAKQLRRKVDQGMLYASISAVLSVANNSAGTWTEGTTQDDYSELVRLIGVAKVKVGNRYYGPTGIVSSMTNAERLSHWEGFTAAGTRAGDERMGNGFIGSVNGLPVFWSTEFPDTYIEVVNRQLVAYRVFQPMQIFGPYPSYSNDGKLIAADQYYVEEFNATDAPVPEKGSYVVIAEGS